VFEIYAVRYGYNGKRVSSENFVGGDEHDVPMPLDYFVWVIKGANKTYVMDTGYDEAIGKKRAREVVRPVGEGLRAVGVDPSSATDVIISHMHFAGNRDLLPTARYHVQTAEMGYCVGPCMHDEHQSFPFEPDDIDAMVRRLYERRVQFHDGDSELEPGLTLHKIGGHTEGLQVARVQTARGFVVIASDASHFYANFEQDRPFPSFHDINAMRKGYDRMRELATSEDHIVPGHDPEVLKRYPAARAGLDGVVRLDLAPRPRG
jgi:glyoxylase-like metal-dependent hydrolase (beta-lactamase superfamily II)